MEVEFYTLDGNADDTLVGSIVLSAKGLIPRPAGESTGMLEELVTQPVYDARSDAMVSPENDPKAWLAALHQVYRSPYLRASEPK